MKRNFVFVLMFMLAIISVSRAQIMRGYGVKIGTTIASQDWEYVPSLGINLSPENRIGFNVGLFAELLNNPLFSIVTEINYLQKGMQIDVLKTTPENPEGMELINRDSRIDYINISALGKLRLNLGVISPYVIAGPKIDFEINKSFSFGEASVVEKNFTNNILGFKFGVGAEIKLMTLNLLAELLYDADFDELYKNDNLKVNSNSIDLRIGLMF